MERRPVEAVAVRAEVDRRPGVAGFPGPQIISDGVQIIGEAGPITGAAALIGGENHVQGVGVETVKRPGDQRSGRVVHPENCRPANRALDTGGGRAQRGGEAVAVVISRPGDFLGFRRQIDGVQPLTMAVGQGLHVNVLPIGLSCHRIISRPGLPHLPQPEQDFFHAWANISHQSAFGSTTSKKCSSAAWPVPVLYQYIK